MHLRGVVMARLVVVSKEIEKIDLEEFIKKYVEDSYKEQRLALFSFSTASVYGNSNNVLVTLLFQPLLG